jgi:hypothetical protein
MSVVKIIIIILFSLLSIKVKGQSIEKQNEDTLTQSIYYQHTIINTKRISVYGYSSYDLNWGDESGIGIVYSIRYRNKKKKLKQIRYEYNK